MPVTNPINSLKSTSQKHPLGGEVWRDPGVWGGH